MKIPFAAKDGGGKVEDKGSVREKSKDEAQEKALTAEDREVKDRRYGLGWDKTEMDAGDIKKGPAGRVNTKEAEEEVPDTSDEDRRAEGGEEEWEGGTDGWEEEEDGEFGIGRGEEGDVIDRGGTGNRIREGMGTNCRWSLSGRA